MSACLLIELFSTSCSGRSRRSGSLVSRNGASSLSTNLKIQAGAPVQCRFWLPEDLQGQMISKVGAY